MSERTTEEMVRGIIPWEIAEDTTFAEQVARAAPGTMLFRVADQLADEFLNWSQPVRLRFMCRNDGTYDLHIMVEPE